MKDINKLILLPMTVLLGASLVFGGCTAAKKPEPTTPAPTTPRATTPAPGYPKEVADRTVSEANKVNGVRGCTAVVSGKNIYVGLDLNSNLEKNKSVAVEKEVLDRVKKKEGNYMVTVSSDVDTVTRIKKVSQGVAAGKPIESFDQEMRDIGNRLQPKTK